MVEIQPYPLKRYYTIVGMFSIVFAEGLFTINLQLKFPWLAVGSWISMLSLACAALGINIHEPTASHGLNPT